MANYRRSDDFEGAAGQQPIVLARLPYVGTTPPKLASVAAPPAPPMPVAPLPAAPLPEAMPQLDLRSEIDQRIRLHIANTPADDQSSSTTHFADREHAVERVPAMRQHAPAPSKRHETARHQSSQQQATLAKPTTLSERLFQLHAQLAPHAGLIVALALIASAGLLYWMIVGPTQAPMSSGFENYHENYHESYSTEPHSEGFGSLSAQMPDNYVPEFAATIPQTTEPVSAPDQWTKVLEMPGPLTQPEASPAELLKLPPANKLHYPTTDRSQALDFTKLEVPTADFPQPLPEVARRPTTTTNR